MKMIKKGYFSKTAFFFLVFCVFALPTGSAPFAYAMGSVTAESDKLLGSAAIRSSFGADGAGMKIGVISDGIDHLSDAIASGDLPDEVHILGGGTGGDEGVAMMEIIYDIAPGAELYFHGGGDSMASFNEAVDRLVEAGCGIIVDDLGYDDEAFFEDGAISRHLAEIMASHDVIFVSAAGNGANAHYQGRFYDDGKGYHDFSEGDSSRKNLYVELPPGEEMEVVLGWDDRSGHSGNDYDLQLYESGTLRFLGESTQTQDGDDDPLEVLYYANNTEHAIDVEIDVSAYDVSASNVLELYIYTKGNISPVNITAADSIYGHPNAEGVLAVGAISVKDKGNNTIEPYSARGPSTFIGGIERDKPDIMALDYISISGAGDFKVPFSGTSASAPAVAAILAQLWGAFPELLGDEIREAILSSAIDLGIDGFDHTYGHGRADAERAYEYLAENNSRFSDDISENVQDGDIIQCKNSADPFAVYIVKIVNGKRYIRHIVSLEIFNFYSHLEWDNLIQLDDLKEYTLSGWVRVNTGANGNPGPHDKVWEINGDQTRHHIDMTAEEFLLHGGSEDAIYPINQGELNLYKMGPAVKLM